MIIYPHMCYNQKVMCHPRTEDMEVDSDFVMMEVGFEENEEDMEVDSDFFMMEVDLEENEEDMEVDS